MRIIVWILVGLSALGFVLATINVLIGQHIVGVGAESFSRASTNLALIAIALYLVHDKKSE